MSINHEQRAGIAWPVLAECAANREQVTYGQLAAAIGIHHRAVRYVLAPMQDYCLAEQLPPLTALVINKGDGLPGSGFIAWSMDDLNTASANVFEFNWSALPNPFEFALVGHTTAELAKRVAETPQSAADVLSIVKTRGIAQALFRSILLKTYDSQCAMCGLTIPQTLEAAHIIPWAQATPQQRLDPRNGVLLCSLHHRLFDLGFMTIGKDETVLCKAAHTFKALSDRDCEVSVDLNNKSLLPKMTGHRPSDEALAHHHTAHGFM